MWEKPALMLLTGFLVRNGRAQNRMITVSPMWEITTCVGTPKELVCPVCGAIPLIPIMKNRIAQFHFAPR